MRLVTKGLPLDVVTEICDRAFSQEDRDFNQCDVEGAFLPPDGAFSSSDIDVFLIAKSQEEANHRIRVLVDQLRVNSGCEAEDFRLVRTANAISVWAPFPNRPVQILVVMYRTMEEVLAFFDLDCVSVGYDGVNVYCLPRFLRAVNTGYNFVEPAKLRRWSTGPRICKYTKRGFGTLFFEVCKHNPRCDVQLDDLTAQRIAAVEANTSAQSDLGYGETVLPFSNSVKLGIHFDLYIKRLGLKERAVAQKLNLNIDGTVAKHFVVSRIIGTDLEEMLSDPALPELRWKVTDLWQSRRGNEFLPKCYMCNRRIDQSETYSERPQLCAGCEALNNDKASQWADLTGHVALVTGGRIKIGYQVALRLLRMNATVLVTTRFPRSAYRTFESEPDFAQWSSRLRIFAVDFRFVHCLTSFLQYIRDQYPTIHIVINNAAQTIRRPPAYYRELVAAEENLPDHESIMHLTAPTKLAIEDDQAANSTLAVRGLTPAQMTQLAVGMEDDEAAMEDSIVFPVGMTDEHGEQLDLRDHTSWTQKPGEIRAVEATEVQLINSVAPLTILNALWNNLTNRMPGDDKPRFVVNVTSPEGQFDTPFKTPHHVHTNMAKAGLNMITRTAYTELAKYRVYITSVDTGWVSTMAPVTKPAPWNNKIAAPLTVMDGAVRVLDPIVDGVAHGNLRTGVLLRNFSTACW
eukprot:c656_g1_i1.p1 GENE.c656_g1_i1~~c656_g1_i1.p1  ORF type:complete len:687 (-),score=157.40 c656_g1_i1:69-2129(-)